MLGAIGHWTSDIFSFSEPDDIVQTDTAAVVDPELDDLWNALLAAGANQPLLPTWMPDGYVQTEFLDSRDTGYWAAVYIQDDSTITISVVKVQDGAGAEYEKDDIAPTIYTVGENVHYIMTNAGRNIGVWTDGDYEYSIGGASEEDLYKMIHSIYGEVP